jgi:hypothetical protein
MTRHLVHLAIAGLAALSTSSSCAIPTNTSTDPIGNLPDKDTFINKDVSTFMEHRCAGLDCHGQDGRPLRLYSEWGLRLEANKDGSRNRNATTDDEKAANYRAVVGLEPEDLARCFASKGGDIATLQLVKKPLDIQGGGIRHKGGPVLKQVDDDPGWQCLFGFVSGNVDQKQCDQAAQIQ